MDPDTRIETLQTRRLLLRTLQTGDEEPLTALLQDVEIYRWTNNIPFPYSIEDAREYIELRTNVDTRSEAFVWAITNRSTNELMGVVGLHDLKFDRGRGELGYWLGQPFRGQGYTTEAARRVLSWGFETGGFYRIQAAYMPGNEASAAVMQKIGMQPEGLLRGYGFKNNEHYDLHLQSVLQSDSTWMSTEDQTALRQ